MMQCDGCSTAGGGVRQGRLALGTVVTVVLPGVDKKEGRALVDQAFAEITRVESILSPFLPGSDVWQLNRCGRCDGATPEMLEVMKRALYHSEISGGAFDVTVVPRPRSKTGVAQPVPGGSGFRNGWRAVGIEGDTIFFTGDGVSVNLGAIAKGYAVDRAVELLTRAGAERGIVNAGGDLRVIGRRSTELPWRIAIRNPRKVRQLMGAVLIEDKAVATSGSYQRMTHDIIDPFTGSETRRFLSVSAVADTAMDADALVTTMFVLGPEKGRTVLDVLDGTAAMWIATDGTVAETPQWKAMGG
jgi:thiamine biosynthesis lipoprotein